MPDSKAAIFDRLRLQRLAAGKAKQPLEQGLRPFGCLKRIREQACRALVAIGIFALENVESAGDRRQQIVEVVRHAAGQLAERLQLLGLVQLRDRGRMLCRPFLDAALQIRRELVQFLEPRPRLILPAAPAKRRLRQADQGRRVERPLEEGDVAEQLEEAPGLGIALEPAAALGEQDERKVRPFRLGVEPAGQSVAGRTR